MRHALARRRTANPLTWVEVIAARQVTTEENCTSAMAQVYSAFEALKSGSTDDGHFDRLGNALNVGLVRAEQINELLVAPILAAHEAVHRCSAIHARHGRYGFDGPGLQAVRTGLEVYEEILRNSSPAQMRAAMSISIARMKAEMAEVATA